MKTNLNQTPEWRWVPGYEGRYQVSDAGQVKSFARPDGRLLTPGTSQNGYLAVWLYRDGKPTAWRIHRLVAEVFLGPRPAGSETRHLDGDQLNNTVANLSYGTRSENMRDRVRHGTDTNAAKTHCPAGHSYDLENTRVGKSGKRQCRACARAAAVLYRQRRREAVSS